VIVGCRAGIGSWPVEPQMWEAPVSANATSVGLDVHARSVVGCGLDGRTGELFERRLTPDHGDVESWVRSLPGPVVVTYEAGPTGFGLARYLTGRGIECQVAAPSKLQRPCGDRIKTDVRDARHLARLLHLGEIVAVAVPSLEQEAARDLVRAREDVRGDLMAARHRLSKLLLRQGIVYCGGKPWTGSHDLWLCAQRRKAVFTLPGLGLAFDAAYDRVLDTVARRDRLDTAITELAAGSEFAPVVTRLGCLRGISTLTAFGLAVEIGDWHRLSGRSIGAYLGLVPTESSSGGSRSLGSITKTGNSHARRLLIEAAWHHRQPYRVGVDLRRRLERATPAARVRGQRANRRLHARWNHFDTRHKRAVVANTAIARELAGWCWSLAVLD
jgi:transposase